MAPHRRARPLPPLPLRWRLILVAIAVLATVLTLFGVVLYAKLGDTLVENTANGLRLSAGAAIAASSPAPKHGKGGPGLPLPAGPSGGPAPDDRRRLQDLAQNLTTRDTAALTTDATGAIVADGPALNAITTVSAPRLDPAVYRAVAAADQERHLRRQTAAGPVLVELIPLSTGTGTAPSATVGVLQLNTSLRPVDDSLATLRLFLVAGTLLAIAATILLTIPLVRGVLRPLRRMAAASRAIAGGDLGRRVQVPAGADELTDLARAFNEMVDRLATMLATQRRFLADVSHELRSPLTALGGGVDVLLLGADRGDPADRARLLHLMEGEIARMGRLIGDLLVLTRFDANPASALQRAPVDLGALAAEVGAATRLLAPDRAVVVEVDAPPGTAIVVAGDVDRLRQALLNLCANARAHTPSGGTIALRVGRGGADATIAVADTGSGIASADQVRVWDRFYRADPARARQPGQGGLGLGLSIVRAIAEAHDGTAELTSTPGTGTTVTLTLPGATTRPAGRAVAPTTDAASPHPVSAA